MELRMRGRLAHGLHGLPAVASAARGIVRRYERLTCRRARYRRPFGSRPPINLAVCAIFRDEARYLAEWVTFHRLQGVERFWLYDNLSQDDWRAALAPELASGIVTVTRWPDEPGQLSAYADCLERHRYDVRWLAFIDVDEFLFSPTGQLLPEVLRAYDSYPGVVVNWRMYGMNGYADAPAGLVTENYLMRARDDYSDNSWVKSIAYPRKARLTHSPHQFDYRGIPVGEDHLPGFTSQRKPATAEILRLNHYFAKSESDWARKRDIPSAVGVITRAERLVPPDDLLDNIMLQFLPSLQEALDHRPG
jgi:Glycosyltransferase family 92